MLAVYFALHGLAAHGICMRCSQIYYNVASRFAPPGPSSDHNMQTPGKAAAAARERMRQFKAAKKAEAAAAAATAASTEQVASPSASSDPVVSCQSPQSTCVQTPAKRTPAKACTSLRKSARRSAVRVQEQTPPVQCNNNGFDFTKYIEPMSNSKPLAAWQPDWLGECCQDMNSY